MDQSLKVEKKDERWKGVLYINIYGILLSLCILLASMVYHRNPEMLPEELLFLRGIAGTFLCIAIVNKDLKYAVYDGVPKI